MLLRLAYDGSRYSGWQIQNNSQKPTLQQTLEEVLFQITQERIRVMASGRTDAGVHALHQAVMFRTESSLTPERFMCALNALLPKDMVVKSAQVVADDFHVMACARKKTYRYLIHNHPNRDVFLRGLVLEYPRHLDVEAMQSACEKLLGTHHFGAFCAANSAAKTFERTIYEATVRREAELVIFEVTGNGFLYNMVRIMVGTLLAISEGKMTEQVFEEAFVTHNRSTLGKTAPPEGLYLVDVSYEA